MPIDVLQARQRLRNHDDPATERSHSVMPPEAETRVELASSLSMAFMMMLERLTPKERAAYLLHDIFDLTYGEVAETLDISESGGRKLVSRARASVSQTKTRHATPEPRQEEFLTAFQSAVETGELGALAQMLAQDARLSTDGGGKVAAIRDPILGRDAICDFVSRKLRRYWAELDWTRADLNGAHGVLIQADGQTSSVVSATFDEAGFVQEILIMRNPEKLRNLNPVQVH
ncbi:sigma factor-like helix-turn-helix DNA-binding protein [Ruegeria sp. A3M17]|uniref:sigma factor-like helix-turn-helix DNA-binding protein n=1 Tax=Ruegeria sp. A3M17 TaxID=2267229 RepID=UPI000DE8F021|nr:sigma factor-like helix-turn-helix DNA-binding protein [Ruegeria sp. A3M17]RBW63396.1 RNA polymerase subunit sigma-24 [Ruegeria sp. A3M17]